MQDDVCCCRLKCVSRGTQLAARQSSQEVNSAPVSFSPAQVSHQEGGWPKEVDSRQRDQVSRYIKKVEKSEDYLDSAVTFSAVSEEKVRQNLALEIYEEYFDREDPATEPEDAGVKTIISYPDPSRLLAGGGEARPVSGISFSPGDGDKMAISYCSPEFLEAVTWSLPTCGYILDLRDPTRHLASLCSESCLTNIQYGGSRQPSVLAGGCYSGQVCWWDLRAGTRPATVTTAPAHTEPVYCLLWTSSKAGTEVTCLLWCYFGVTVSLSWLQSVVVTSYIRHWW